MSNLGPVQWKLRFNSYNLATALNAYLFRLAVKASYFEIFQMNDSLLEFNFVDFQLLHFCKNTPTIFNFMESVHLQKNLMQSLRLLFSATKVCVFKVW